MHEKRLSNSSSSSSNRQQQQLTATANRPSSMPSHSIPTRQPRLSRPRGSSKRRQHQVSETACFLLSVLPFGTLKPQYVGSSKMLVLPPPQKKRSSLEGDLAMFPPSVPFSFLVSRFCPVPSPHLKWGDMTF